MRLKDDSSMCSIHREKELEYVVDCLKTNWISSKGGYAEEFEEKFAEYCGCKYGITTTSGTTTLHLDLASIDVKKKVMK